MTNPVGIRNVLWHKDAPKEVQGELIDYMCKRDGGSYYVVEWESEYGLYGDQDRMDTPTNKWLTSLGIKDCLIIISW